MTLKFHSDLSKDLALILNDSDDFNVIIQAGENQDTKEFYAHSIILRARSPYFKGALSSNWITKKNDMIMFNKPNITPTVFDMILKYIYTGELDFTNQSSGDVLGLLVASDELLIEELFKHTQCYLIRNRASWIQNNFDLVLNTVFKLVGCEKLQDYCLELICKDPRPFITSKHFTSLDKNILLELLKRDDLRIEEVVVWDYLIKWGIEQTPGSSKWNNKNHEALKKTLNEYIPFIRFAELTSIEFFNKVLPYKAIIPNHIYKEMDKFYSIGTLPKTTSLLPRAGMVSTIIKPKLVTIIANWIDRNDLTIHLPNTKYKFNLIYLMTRDGFDRVTFYDKCKGKGSFVVLIRVQSKKIYGGYNPIGYTGRNNGWQSSTESFVFSFENDQDTHKMKIGRVVAANYSIHESVNNGNFFNFGKCLYITSGKKRLRIGTNSSHYINIFNKSDFIIEEIEVFSVDKK